MKDLVPELINSIHKSLYENFKENKLMNGVKEKLDGGIVGYDEVYKYAEGVGEATSKALHANITSEVLPDGKIYYNIADRVMNDTLNISYDEVTEVSSMVQSILNAEAGIGLNPANIPINQSRIDGIVERLSREAEFEDISWIFDEVITNFCMSIVDDTVYENADLHHKLGLSPKIIRKAEPDCCEWCSSLAGEYDYKDVNSGYHDVFKRHKFCKCTVDYVPVTGKVRRVHG